MAVAHASETPDPAAGLTALYREHATDAFRFALHLTGRREDAEDVVQFVFLQAHRQLTAGRPLMNPRAWLMTAVKHRSFNVLRDRREVPVDEVVVAAAPSGPPARDEAGALREVRGMLWTLPEKQHHAFVLRHWCGLSQAEIAGVLDTTPSAVESLLSRAHTTLLSEQASSAECVDARRRLIDAQSPAAIDVPHLNECHRCRTAKERLLRTSNFASAFALAPGLHVAQSLESLVHGFSAHAATVSTGAAGWAPGPAPRRVSGPVRARARPPAGARRAGRREPPPRARRRPSRRPVEAWRRRPSWPRSPRWR